MRINCWQTIRMVFQALFEATKLKESSAANLCGVLVDFAMFFFFFFFFCQRVSNCQIHLSLSNEQIQIQNYLYTQYTQDCFCTEDACADPEG